MELPWEPLRMAPSYANLFLAKFETDAFSRAPYQPHTWWRYIDDIFMIWTHSVDDLQTFTTYLNNIHPTIKFTSNYSFTSIPFLDVNVSLINGKITTDLYTKPTDKHQYLLFVLLATLSRNELLNSKLTLTNGDTTCPSLTNKYDVFTT